jgi:hypothetical protein
MSIEMKNPKSVLEKVEAAANLVAQIQLANMTGDTAHIKCSAEAAGELLFEVSQALQE